MVSHREDLTWYRVHQGCIARSVISATFHILARLNQDRTGVRDFFVVPGYTALAADLWNSESAICKSLSDHDDGWQAHRGHYSPFRMLFGGLGNSGSW